jgi:hypothetical protein
MKLVIIIFSAYFLVIEVLQMRFNGFSYFTDKTNWIQLATFSSNLVILCLYIWSTGYEPLHLAYAASVSSFLLWLQVFYWMRLFRSMSFYVLMVYETMYDIRHFLIMFFACVAAFGNAVLILDFAQSVASRLGLDDPENEYAPIINDSTGNSPLDAILN